MLIVFGLGAGNVVVYLLDLDRDIRDHVFNEQIAIILASVTLARDGSNLDRLPHSFSESDWRFSLYNGNRRLIATSPREGAPLPFVEPGLALLDRRQPITGRAVGDDRVLVLARNDWEECEELCQIFRQRMAGSSILIAGLAFVSFVSMSLLAGWMLRSVARAAELGKSIGIDYPDRRIPLHELPTEIVPLARSANEALDRLAAAYQSERRFTADAAHELRTPLTVLSLRLQKARQEESVDWASVSRDMQQLQRLIEQLLALARADSQTIGPIEGNRVNPARIIRETVADILPLYESAEREIAVATEEGIVVSAPATALRQALRNLIENALHHGTGLVTVTLRTHAGLCIIEVGDEGAGHEPGMFEAMFERFHKGEQSQSGSGLGLSIVRQIMRNLGGSVEIVDAANFRMRLSLPLAPPAANS